MEQVICALQKKTSDYGESLCDNDRMISTLKIPFNTRVFVKVSAPKI